MKENKNFRETLATLKERFPGKDSIDGSELAKYLGKSPPTIYESLRKGELPGKKVGKNYVTTLIQLAHWECE